MDFCRGREYRLPATCSHIRLFVCLCCLVPTHALAASCDDQIGKVIAAEGGSIRYGRSGESPIKGPEVAVCLNSVISVKRAGRVTIELSDPAAKKANNGRPIVTLGPNSSLSFKKPPRDRTWVLDLVEGWFRFFSPRPTNIDVETPYVSAGVRGTEFVLHSQNNACQETGEKVGCAVLWVQEGRVSASNPLDSVEIDAKGPESARTVVARLGQALEVRALQITPEDAVNWVVQYLPLSKLRPPRCDAYTEQIASSDVRKAIACGSPATVQESLQRIPASASDAKKAELYGLAAARLLTAGDVVRAAELLDKATALSANASFYAMKSVVALKQNDKSAARAEAERGLALDVDSPDALLAMSYVRQAEFDLPGARADAQRAAKNAEHDPLLAARLAELDLSLGDTATALMTAKKAVANALIDSSWTENSIKACRFEGGVPANSRDAVLSRSYTILGFTRMIRLEASVALAEMKKAVCADDQAPLARLGHGLALIRQGELDTGVRQLELAVALDPNVSLYRSYLGKGYFEQKLSGRAKEQFEIAKVLDADDPTPWLYDAYRARTDNALADALHAIEKSKELNGERAIYRSKLLLDSDDAVRTESLGRVYQELGFDSIAHLEGSRSVTLDPANHSAHRLLADAAARNPRADVTRVSELLQARTRAPRIQHPTSVLAGESRLPIATGASALPPGFNEYSTLFDRDGLNLSASLLHGSRDTLSDELRLSWAEGPVSAAISQYHVETDGFRDNHYQDLDYWNLLGQFNLSANTSVQFEYRHLDFDHGDLFWGFDPNDYAATDDINDSVESWRLSGHHVFSPAWDIVAMVKEQDADASIDADDGSFFSTTDDSGSQSELQSVGRFGSSNFVLGIGTLDRDRSDSVRRPPMSPFALNIDSETDHKNVYAYWSLLFEAAGDPGSERRRGDLLLTLGVSRQDYDTESVARVTPPVGPPVAVIPLELERKEILPKLGALWVLPNDAGPEITLRAAYFETLRRALLADETLEPTTVAGFDQFFDEVEATLADVTAVGIDIGNPSGPWYAGLAARRRDTDFTGIDLRTAPTLIQASSDETLYSAYAHWLPTNELALSMRFEHDTVERNPTSTGVERIIDLKTKRLFTNARYFFGSGLTLNLEPIWIDQRGSFVDRNRAPYDGNEDFWVVNASASYKLPRRLGHIAVSIENLFDEDFNYQDVNPFEPRFSPERAVYVRGTLAF